MILNGVQEELEEKGLEFQTCQGTFITASKEKEEISSTFSDNRRDFECKIGELGEKMRGLEKILAESEESFILEKRNLSKQMEGLA
jgi:hypothetical protein